MTSLPVFRQTFGYSNLENAQCTLSLSKIRFFRDSNPESKSGLRFESESESGSWLDDLLPEVNFQCTFRVMQL